MLRPGGLGIFVFASDCDYRILGDNGLGLHGYQREEVDGWADRLTTVIEDIINEGMADGSLETCEPKLVVQLLLGMLIWLAKWVPSIKGLTPERLMRAIDDVAFRGIGASPLA